MKTFLLPKHVPAVSWGVFVLLVLSALAIYGAAGTSMPRARNAAESQGTGDDTQGIERAMASLQDIRRQENERGTRAPIADQIIAPSPAVQKNKSAAVDESAGMPSLIVLQTAKGFAAVIDGRTVHLGQKLENGDVVQKIGKTFIVLKPPTGDVKQIDMKNRFLPRPLNQKQENVK